MSRCLLCVFSVVLGISVLMAGDPDAKKKPKLPKYKLIYTISNSGTGALNVELYAFGQSGEFGDGKTYLDTVPPGKTKKCTATVYSHTVPAHDFQVTITKQGSIADALIDTTFKILPGVTPGKFSRFVSPDDQQLDFAYVPLMEAPFVWSNNPKHK